MLTFKSTRPERFWVIGEDEHGRRRMVSAEKWADDFGWKLKYQHPNYVQEGIYNGRAGLLDALGEMFAKHDSDFVQSRENNDRPRQAMMRDQNRNPDGFVADVRGIPRGTR
jgi:hypothetical protein